MYVTAEKKWVGARNMAGGITDASSGKDASVSDRPHEKIGWDQFCISHLTNVDDGTQVVSLLGKTVSDHPHEKINQDQTRTFCI